METTILTSILLPLLLALIMFGMGTTLTPNDFKRLLVDPKPVLLGLSAQLVFMPIIAIMVVAAYGLTPELAIGLLILAVCPGGTTSNLICHILRANLALSVTLTALATVVCVFSAPILIKLALDYYQTGHSADFSMGSATLGLFAITLLPVLLGIMVGRIFVNFARVSEPYFRKGSVILMVLMIALIVYDERATIFSKINDMFVPVMTLCLATIALGATLAKFFGLDRRDQITLGIEVGLQNASLAMLIAMTFIGNNDYAIAAGVYGTTMYLGVAVAIWIMKHRIFANQTTP